MNDTSASLIPGGAAAALFASALAIVTPLDVLLFLCLALVFTASGWPLSRWLAGDRADRLTRGILAVLLGYLVGSLIYGVLRLAGLTSPIFILAACLVVALALTNLLRRPQVGVVSFASLGAADRAALGLLWLLVAVIVGPVFARVGLVTGAGLAYRAYFIADLFAHMTVVAELVKHATPPLNPFFPHEPLPYYWTYFALPALFDGLRPMLLVDRGILLTDLVAGSLVVSTGFITVRSLGASTLATTVSWVVVITASSFEGAFFLWRQWMRARPLDAFRFVNIDGYTRWLWDLPPVDGLHRLLWYTPQHAMALSFGLVVVLIVVRAQTTDGAPRGIADGLLLGGALAVSSFNGVLLVGWYALAEVLALVARRGRDLGGWLAGRATAAAIVGGVAGFAVALGMVQRTPGAFILGWNHHFLKGPWAFISLSFGPALFLAPLGLRRLAGVSSRAAPAVMSLVVVSATVFALVDLNGHENSYVTFRTSQLVFLALAVLLAFAIDTWRSWRSWTAALSWAVLVLSALAAAPTVALDWYNARDISNVEANPGGFPWTIYVSPDDVAAATWVREQLPVDATVQTDAAARARNTWAFVTAFAERRMGTGMGIFELNPARFVPAVDRIHAVFQTPDARAAYDAASQLGIEYVYVGDVERQADGGGIWKFEHHPDQFELVYRKGTVEIFRVAR